MRKTRFVAAVVLIGGAMLLWRGGNHRAGGQSPAPVAQAPAPASAAHDHEHPGPPVLLASTPATEPGVPPLPAAPPAGVRAEHLVAEKDLQLTDDERRERREKSERLIDRTVAWLEAQRSAVATAEEGRLLAIRIERLNTRRRQIAGKANVEGAAAPSTQSP